jgi:hypothetical protein
VQQFSVRIEDLEYFKMLIEIQGKILYLLTKLMRLFFGAFDTIELLITPTKMKSPVTIEI